MAANKAVRVVPIFAPNKNGKALCKGSLLVATIGTIREVTKELDCTTPVISVPAKSERIGLPKSCFSKKEGASFIIACLNW